MKSLSFKVCICVYMCVAEVTEVENWHCPLPLLSFLSTALWAHLFFSHPVTCCSRYRAYLYVSRTYLIFSASMESWAGIAQLVIRTITLRGLERYSEMNEAKRIEKYWLNTREKIITVRKLLKSGPDLHVKWWKTSIWDSWNSNEQKHVLPGDDLNMLY